MVNPKDYLEMNSGLENTWPRLEICLTSRAIRKRDRTSYGTLAKYLTQYPLILFNVEDIASLFLVTVKKNIFVSTFFLSL